MKTIKAAVLFVFVVFFSLSSQASPTESDYLEMLHSGDFQKMKEALHSLPLRYPNSTNAIAAIKQMLHNSHEVSVTEICTTPGKSTVSYVRHIPPTMIARLTARALGNYHATATDADLDVIFDQLIGSHVTDTAMDGLKALRGMNVPQAVPRLLPLLEDGNKHVVQDTLRTLAVLGDESLIPRIEPLIHSPIIYVAGDARDAINKLKMKAKINKSGKIISDTQTSQAQ